MSELYGIEAVIAGQMAGGKKKTKDDSEFHFIVSDGEPLTINCTLAELGAAYMDGRTLVCLWSHYVNGVRVVSHFYLADISVNEDASVNYVFRFEDKTSSGVLEIRADGTVTRSYQDNSDVTIHFESVLQTPTLSHSYAEMVAMGASALLKRTIMDVAGYNAYRPFHVFIGNDVDAGWCIQFSFLNWTASKNTDETTRFPTSSVRTVYVTAEKAYLVDKSFYNCLADA